MYFLIPLIRNMVNLQLKAISQPIIEGALFKIQRNSNSPESDDLALPTVCHKKWQVLMGKLH